MKCIRSTKASVLKAIVTALLVVFVVSGAVLASAFVTYSSGTLSAGASSLVYAGKGSLTGVLIMTDGVNNATVTIYDNASAASGTKLFGPVVVTGPSWFGGATWEIPVRCNSGIYATVSGTGSSAIIYYTDLQ